MVRGKSKRPGPQEDHATAKADEAEVSDYERARLARIKRNEAFMETLSISALKTAPSTPAAAAKKRSPSKRPRDPASRTAPSRTSKRLRSQAADPEDLVALPGTWISSLAGATTKPGGAPSSFRQDYGPELNPEEAQERMEVLKGHIGARDEAKAGTASYNHCLHRVRTMSDVSLARRVRTIERARGAQAKEKMLVFSRVLTAKGKTDLAEMAEAALDRLVRGVPMPEKES
ncbi:unnamed protein product [Ectocarpus sp. 12 AP-2014]